MVGSGGYRILRRTRLRVTACPHVEDYASECSVKLSAFLLYHLLKASCSLSHPVYIVTYNDTSPYRHLFKGKGTVTGILMCSGQFCAEIIALLVLLLRRAQDAPAEHRRRYQLRFSSCCCFLQFFKTQLGNLKKMVSFFKFQSISILANLNKQPDDIK